jgi:hypothetical protein
METNAPERLGLRCAWCGKILRESPHPDSPLGWTHGICPVCQRLVELDAGLRDESEAFSSGSEPPDMVPQAAPSHRLRWLVLRRPARCLGRLMQLALRRCSFPKR